MADAPPPIGKTHARRLREVYRSAGWPCQDLVEIELLAAGLLERVRAATGHETLRVTDAGIRRMLRTMDDNNVPQSDRALVIPPVEKESLLAIARFTEQAPRIGLRGTAKVYAKRVPLAVYLFRRPLAALRKTLGL